MVGEQSLRDCHDISGTIGRPRFVIGARRDEGTSRDDVTEEQRRPGPKMGLPVGAALLIVSILGMLKKAASGVLAIVPCSRTESTLRASQ